MSQNRAGLTGSGLVDRPCERQWFLVVRSPETGHAAAAESPSRTGRPVRTRSALRRSLRIAKIATLVWGLSGGQCFAQAAEGSAAGEKVELIREQMERGQGLFAAGKYAEAAEVFEEGFRKHPYSAFLFNAGVCHEKAGQLDRAVRAFELYLAADPRAPDADSVRERLTALEAARLAQASHAAEPQPPEGAPAPEPVAVAAVPNQEMKALVVVETTPPGAPLQVYRRRDEAVPAFVQGQPNEGWPLVASRTAPVELTLEPGRYHLVVEKFGDFNQSEADIDVSAGHVHHFQANLSQGAFMGFLRVSANVPGAYVFLDDPKMARPPWGQAPYAELVSPGPHEIVVQAPGYQPLRQQVELAAGDQKEITVELVRLGYGIVRIDSNVGEVKLAVDGRPVGFWKQGTAAFQMELPAGHHELVASAEGHKDLRSVFDVPRGQVLPMRVQMVPKYPRGTAWTQAIIGATVLGASTYFGIESNRLYGELEDERRAGNLDSNDPRATRGFWYAIGADAGFVLGGVFGGLATYNFIKDPYPDSSLRKGARQEFEDKLRGHVAPPPPAAVAPAAAPPPGVWRGQ